MHLNFKEYPQRGEEMSMPVPEKLPPGPSLTITAPTPATGFCVFLYSFSHWKFYFVCVYWRILMWLISLHEFRRQCGWT